MKEAAKAGHDLFLAGHTHGGQFWPNRYFTKRAFDLDYGVKRYGNMMAYVTSGYGMWGTPLPTGSETGDCDDYSQLFAKWTVSFL